MPNYQNGKIYKMVSLVDDYFYIGSTTLGLAQRRSQHTSNAKKQTTRAVYVHFNSIGWDNCRIVLIDNYPCESKDELVKKEFEHIQANNNDKLLNVLKYIGSMCEHNRQRNVCKECGGGSVCDHNKVRSVCKECGGGSICEHNRRRTDCKECGGGKICEHNRMRTVCKDCGGSQICQHNRIKQHCKECGGSQICQHNKQKGGCKECNGDTYYCYECEIGFGNQYKLTRHERSKQHTKKYNTMFEECFGSN